MRYVIIGAGVAGYSALQAIRSVDKTGEIVMISDDPNGYYSRPGLAYYLTGELDDKALVPQQAGRLQEIKFQIHSRTCDQDHA